MKTVSVTIYPKVRIALCHKKSYRLAAFIIYKVYGVIGISGIRFLWGGCG